jgi:hypothetical protein
MSIVDSDSKIRFFGVKQVIFPVLWLCKYLFLSRFLKFLHIFGKFYGSGSFTGFVSPDPDPGGKFIVDPGGQIIVDPPNPDPQH